MGRQVKSDTDTKPQQKRGENNAGVVSWICRHPVWLSLGIALILVGFPFVLLRVMQAFDVAGPDNAYTRLDGGINTWLGFWGSYLGFVATVILSVCALVLSKKINQHTWYKNTADEVNDFNKFEVENIYLYDLNVKFRNDLNRFKGYDAQRFMLYIKFQRPFPPQYSVEIEKIIWFENTEEKSFDTSLFQGEPDLISILCTPKETSLRILIPDKDEYMLGFYTPNKNIKFKDRNKKWPWLTIQIRCENTLFHNKHEYYRPLRVILELWLKNEGGHDDEGDGVLLSIEARKLFCDAVEE